MSHSGHVYVTGLDHNAVSVNFICDLVPSCCDRLCDTIMGDGSHLAGERLWLYIEQDLFKETFSSC